jgi:hypothetical protein
MTFMIEFALPPDERQQMLAKFEAIGPNRMPGVAFRKAWVATHENRVFALVESTNEAQVQAACAEWTEQAPPRIIPVVDIEQV